MHIKTFSQLALGPTLYNNQAHLKIEVSIGFLKSKRLASITCSVNIFVHKFLEKVKASHIKDCHQ